MFPLHDPLNDILREELVEYDDLTAALLARRGVLTKIDAEKFLNPSYDQHLHDPLLMTDMQKAAERSRCRDFFRRKNRGVERLRLRRHPGRVIVLHDFLKKVSANFEIYIPHRHDEGYGMNITGIEKLAANGVKLMVTVDSGITDTEPISRAKELGIEVIITDHHLPAQVGLPNAFAIVNPNARADEIYPFHELCGAGIAWKLVCATLSLSPELREKVPVGWEKWLL